MQSSTGEIKQFSSEVEAKKAGFDVSLTENQYNKLKPMSKNQRKAWNKKLRRG